MSNTKNIQFNNINLEFIQCPAGSFTMGSSNGLPLELPVRQVKIENPFWISTTLVTQALWTEVMPGNPSRFTGSGNLPVDSISYDAALAFCEAANVNYAVQFRLPTEAEWEYACRAGTMTEYFWGASSADALKYGWFDMNAQEQTHPVAELAPNPWGLYDVVGNLWEWCEDVWHSDYNNAPVNSEAWTSNAEQQPRRCLRGGAYNMDVFRMRSAYRSYDHRELGLSQFGLRVVMSD